MNELRRHKLVFFVLMPAVSVFTKLFYNYKYDSLRDIEGPYLLMVNHNLELDPIAVGVSCGRQIYFVASEHLLRKGFATKLLMYCFKLIVHEKGRPGIQSVAKILRTLRAGNSVCLFPEGNRSFNGLTAEIAPATGKLARRSGAKLVTYRLEGGYLTNPRWSKSVRRGHLYGKLVNVYTPEQLAVMTDAEVNEAICRDLHEDAYETQARIMSPYKGKHLALGLETALFACPGCGAVGSLRSDDHGIGCSCGYRAEYDKYGYLTTPDGSKTTVTEWDGVQRRLLGEKLSAARETGELLFSDEVALHDIAEDHSLSETSAVTLRAYADRLEFGGYTLPFSDISGMAIYSRNCLILQTPTKKGHFEFKSELEYSALKYLYLYEMVKKNIEAVCSAVS